MAHRRLVIRERITAIIGSALLLLIVLTSYWYSLRADLEGLKYVPSDKSPDFLAKNVSLTDFDETGTPKFKAFAEHLQHFSDERMRAEKGLVVSLAPNEATARARADEIWSDDGMETVEFSGNVVVTRAPFQGEPELEFRSGYVRGWLDTLRFETDKPVYMRRGSDTTEAQGGMMYDNVARTVELKGRVGSVLHPENFREPAP